MFLNQQPARQHCAPPRARPPARGFTIVELVVVLVLLGVLSGVAISRSVQPSAFTEQLLRDFVIAELRYAQRLAALRDDAEVSVRLLPSGAGWQAQTWLDGVTLDRQEAWDSDARLSQGGQALATQFSVTYAKHGELAAAAWDGAALDVQAGIGFSAIAAAEQPLCIYPHGYVARGACR